MNFQASTNIQNMKLASKINRIHIMNFFTKKSSQTESCKDLYDAVLQIVFNKTQHLVLQNSVMSAYVSSLFTFYSANKK